MRARAMRASTIRARAMRARARGAGARFFRMSGHGQVAASGTFARPLLASLFWVFSASVSRFPTRRAGSTRFGLWKATLNGRIQRGGFLSPREKQPQKQVFFSMMFFDIVRKGFLDMRYTRHLFWAEQTDEIRHKFEAM